jgi:ParB family chromosome partitioning protein
MNILEIGVELIDAGDRLRGLNAEYVSGMAVSFDAEGQLTPIEVRAAGKGRYKLVFGLHRLAAAQMLGWATIQATIFEGSAEEARLREIDENLVRRELSALDRSVFLASRAEIWAANNKAVAGRRAGAMARWHANDTVSFASDAAEKLGMSVRTVQRWVKLALALDGLQGAVRERVATTLLADKPAQLRALAKLDSDEARNSVIERIVAGEAHSVEDAVAQIEGRQKEHVTGPQAEFDAFMGRWAKYGADTRKLIAAFVARETKAKAPRKPKAKPAAGKRKPAVGG